MRICLAVYNQRLAALFDTAGRLFVVDAHDTDLTPAGEIIPAGSGAAARVEAVQASHAEVLICGALSRCTRYMLSDAGIIVWDWIRGDIDQVLAAWQEERLPELSMPGCILKRPCCKRR